MTEAIRKAVALLQKAKLCLARHGDSQIGFTKSELKTLIAALEDMQGVADRTHEITEVERNACRSCEGSGEMFVKRDTRGKIDYLSGRVINNETTRCDRCRGDGFEP
jgi:translation elongation factor EF-1beta